MHLQERSLPNHIEELSIHSSPTALSSNESLFFSLQLCFSSDV